MSTHSVDIVEIKELLPHPNPEATALDLVIIKGWQCCVGKGQFKVGDKAIYIEPDFLVPLAKAEFSFLRNSNNEGKTQERIKVRKFKGALSQGLLISVPDSLKDLPIGTNVINELGIERYEPPIETSTFGMYTSAPSGPYAPKFDVESYNNYEELFTDGEEVIVTEKIHGANSRWCFAKNKDGNYQQFVGSRTNWMAEDNRNIWWLALRQNPAIGQWCEANPEKILYAEVFGQVQSLKYGAKQNQFFIAPFAILDKQTWLDYDVCQELIKPFPEIKWAPLVYRGPFDKTKLRELAELDSTFPGAVHLREGIVIVPAHERVDTKAGRVCLKIVSNRYLSSRYS